MCLGVILVIILCGYGPAAAFGGGTYMSAGKTYAVVNNPNPSDRLHLRTQPRMDALSLGRYYNGVAVEVLSVPSATWYEVRIGSTVGYMSSQYLAAYAVPAMPTMIVHNPNPADRLNLRAGMSAASASLGKYANGKQVVVLGVGAIWHHVAVDGKIGYMMAKYLKAPNGSGGSGQQRLYVNNPNPADRLNLRAQPRVDSPSIGKYFNGVSVEVLSYMFDPWVRVRIGKTVGYMHKNYLRAAPVASAIPTVKVNNPNARDRLNLRAGMSVLFASLGKYGNGTRVEVLGVSMGWYHVRVNDKIGYMMSKFLTPIPGSASAGSR